MKKFISLITATLLLSGVCVSAENASNSLNTTIDERSSAVEVGSVKTEFVRLKKLVPYEEPNSDMYAALSEIEVWGYDAD